MYIQELRDNGVSCFADFTIQVDKPEWLSMTLVDHKLQRIVKPILWKDVEIDIGGGPTISYTRPADRPRKEWLQDLKASIGFSDEDRPKPRGVFLAHMNTFKEVLEDVVAFTHHLKLKVPLDMEEVREPYVQLAFDAIRRSKELITLDMSGTELHERWWTALNNTLNGTSEASSNLRSRLEHVGFPSLDKKTCTERVYKAIHTYRTSEWPENYLGISPMNACFEFGTKGKKTSTDRTIVVSVDGSYLPLNIPLGDVEVDLFRDTDFYHGTDMDIVQKFMHKMGFPKDRGAFHSLSARRRVIYDWEYPSYESLLQSLELGSATAPLTITNLTLEGISFSWPHDRYEEDLARIAMPQLRKLHLLECKQFDQFLQEIAQTPGMQLSTFHCMNPRRESPDEDTTYIQRFLESISGLQDLTLHATLPWALDEQSALANHMSLRRLDLRYEDKSYPVPAISNLAKLCPNLVTLGFQIDVLGQVIKFGVIKSDMRKAMKRIVKALTEFHLLDTLNIYFSVVSVKETDTTDDDTARVERFRMVAETFYQLVQKINNDSSKATAPSAIQKVTLRMRQPHFASLEKLTRLDNPHIPAWMYEPEYEQTYCHTDLGIMDSTNFAVPG